MLLANTQVLHINESGLSLERIAPSHHGYISASIPIAEVHSQQGSRHRLVRKNGTAQWR
jgi:hypothetical protein